MKIGIIVHSHTGNTLSVAERLKEKLVSAGHWVKLERVTAINEDPSAAGKIQLKENPDTSGYDILIFGAPVRAFSLSPVMKAYLSQLPSLQGKKVSGFVTQQLKYPWMGGNRAITTLKKICAVKSAEMLDTGIVNWSHKEREKRIVEVLEKLSKL
jgi:flavodoxin